ncbi:adenylate/guanylate cyclase domain-containing protein [Nonomuraea sp. CA-141351]|uniref:adenylate/guanylate cyclase domain-containing protein n=1 Tax=Nonomuraea sp. CA-141351 TaxID=3239996 RepID=UPI003D935AFF
MSGARKQVTMVFCDLTESTALSERLDPESLRAVMLSYYEAMRACLESHGGVVEKFIGDAVMGVFGLPTVHEDDALRAARAALAMRAALDRLNDDLAERLDVRLNVRMGIESGEVATADDAAAGQALVTGEVVNVAARLQQQAPPGGILIGEGAHALTGLALATTPLGEVSVRGKAEPVRVWRLRGVREDDPALNRRFDAPFVDREQALRELDSVFAKVIELNACHRVTLVGEAGLGKTRLVRFWAEKATRRGALFGAGRCAPYGEGGALRALADALRQALGEREGPAHDVLHRGLFRNGTLGPVPEETLWAITTCLKAAGVPVLLAIDDLHWASPELLGPLRQLEERLDDVPVMLLCAARPDAPARPPSLVLRPLPATDCQRLSSALLDTTAHDADVLERVVRRCEGNPFYLEQLVALICDGVDPERVPPALRALLSARIDALRSAERHVLTCASVIGREFGQGELEALYESDANELLIRLTHKQLVEAAGERYRFTSTLIQQVVYAETAKSTRADLHRRLADHLDRSGEQPAAVGTHLATAYRLRCELARPDTDTLGLRDRAATRLASGGEQALRHGDLSRAVHLLEDAYSLMGDENALVVERLGEARIALGDAAQGVPLLHRALRLGDERVACHARIYMSYLGGGLPEVSALEAAAVFEAAGDDLGLARAMVRLGQLAQSDGRFAQARTALERGLAHAIEADAELERATALGALAVSLWLGPEPASIGVARCEELLSRHGRGRRTVQAVVGCPLAVLLALNGDFGQAERALARAEAILSELGHAYAAAFVPMFSASVAHLAGRAADAEELLRRALDAATALADAQLRVTAVRDLARVLYEQGQVDQAYALAREGLADPEGAQPMLRAEFMSLTARILVERPLADEAWNLAVTTDSPLMQARVLADRAHVRAAQGDAHGAREDLAIVDGLRASKER